jgi:hypothetical protein
MAKYTDFEAVGTLPYTLQETGMSRTFRVRLPRELDEQLQAICEAARLPVSTAIRLAVEHVLNDPAAWQIFQRGLPFNAVDTRSPAQVRAYEQYEAEAARFDMNSIVRESGLV